MTRKEITRPFILGALLKIMLVGALSVVMKPSVAQPESARTTKERHCADSIVCVSGVQLGNGIDDFRKIITEKETFSPIDVIYASVRTAGTGNAKLNAKWEFHQNGQVIGVAESSQMIAATGPAETAFHIKKGTDWPQGDYQVEISIDDKTVVTKKFTVATAETELANKASNLKSGKLRPANVSDLIIVYGGENGDALASMPKVRADGQMYSFVAELISSNESAGTAIARTYIGRQGDYFMISIPRPLRQSYAQNARINGIILVSGRYTSNFNYETVSRERKVAPVIDAVHLGFDYRF